MSDGWGPTPTALARAGNPYQTLVYTVLATYAHPDSRRAWPSMARLAKDTGVSENTVERAIKALEADGWITVYRRVTGQMKRGNLYVLHSNPPPEGIDASPQGPVTPHHSVRNKNQGNKNQERELQEPLGSYEPKPLSVLSTHSDEERTEEERPEQEHEPAVDTAPSSVQSTSVKSRRKPAVPWPSTWAADRAPTLDITRWTDAHCPDIDAGHEWAQFHDHAHANDRRQADWAGAWRMWARKAQRRATGNGKVW